MLLVVEVVFTEFLKRIKPVVWKYTFPQQEFAVIPKCLPCVYKFIRFKVVYKFVKTSVHKLETVN